MSEFCINKVYMAKYGDLVIGLKFKREDYSNEDFQRLHEYWQDGTPLEGFEFSSIKPFQQEGGEYIPPPPKEKSVYEKLRWEVVKNKPEEEKEEVWNTFKEKHYYQKFGTRYQVWSPVFPSNQIWTEEEAEELLRKFQGLHPLK